MSYRLEHKTTELLEKNVSFYHHNNYRNKSTNKKTRKMISWASLILLTYVLQGPPQCLRGKEFACH